MKKITFISCMNLSYYHKIGKKFLQSVVKYFPVGSMKIIVYCENFRPVEYHPKLIYKSTSLFDSSYKNFLNSNAKRGSKKFAHKVWSVIYSLEELNTHLVIWLDSDIIITKPLTYDWIINIMPPHKKFLWYLSNGQKWGMETGFMGFNKTHPEVSRFIEIYKSYYTNIKKGKKLPKFKDAFVFAEVVRLLPENCYSNISLTKEKSVRNIFDDSPLGERMTHYIGAKKLSDKI